MSINTFIILGVIILFIAAVIIGNPFIQKNDMRGLEYSIYKNEENDKLAYMPESEESKFNIVSIEQSQNENNETNYTNKTKIE